ncbi:Flp family type IVb pilin [Lignipirellula cremea]|uniref:Uncharacterized protein n=1 Tax=Lignipirellula cremea TaxID=2528010 RepID=A0A518E546_9BACT|nr:hypothetical protein [Lignipirellula cremea]QDU99210.1 hypothetical protein Pla8534_71230 [Lignipirellula cremea]
MLLLKRLWNDEVGAVVSIELVLIGTVLLLGVMVGLGALRDSVNNELADVGGAIDEINQSYIVNSVTGHSISVGGSQFVDALDFCDGNDNAGSVGFNGCITHTNGTGSNEGTAAP